MGRMSLGNLRVGYVVQNFTFMRPIKFYIFRVLYNVGF